MSESTECYQCTDFVDDRAVCYVCHQRMQKRIAELEQEIKNLRKELERVGGDR
jgi:uncharacterized protein YceH (UPF0502 family)